MSDAASERWRRLRPLLAELLEEDDVERERRLAELDPELAADLRRLLRADRTPEQHPISVRLDRAVAEQAAAVLADQVPEAEEDARAALAEGMEIGPWRLVRLLGRGGMAEVWEARRSTGDFEQSVAVKLLKRGMDSDEIVARFLRERQILARLDHPGIARLFDGGVSADGRPYFVLERVDGEPITAWCERRGLDVAARLALLVECCAAVDAAHRQLVVHRDLKPHNILVTGSGQVKLLDFGIAKLLVEAELGAEATRTGVRVLTPAYAAPEQLLGEPVSTATDVYSLGVIAYELLTGRLPHRRRLRAEPEPTFADSVERPSSAILGATRNSERRVEPPLSGSGPRARRRLARALSGDIDTIVLQALRREPERRYPSVAALADDLRRHLDGRPISARPDSIAYRARKFVGRHLLGVAAATVVALSLAAGLVTSLWQAQQARQQAQRAESIRAFLTSVFEVSAPEQSRGAPISARQLLDEGAKRVDLELASQPGLRAEMLDLLAGLYRKLGAFEPARDLATRSYELRTELDGAESASAAASEVTLGWTLSQMGQLAEARGHLEHAVAVLEHSAGPDSVAAADAREPLVELTFRDEGPQATLPIVQQRLDVYRRRVGELDQRTGLCWSDLGVVETELGHLDEAAAAYARAASALDQVLPANDPRTAYPHNNLAILLSRLHRPGEAVAEARRAFAIRSAALGPDHVDTLTSQATLANVLSASGDYGQAEATARSAYQGFLTVDGTQAAQVRSLLGSILLAAGRPADALTELDATIPVLESALGSKHVLVLGPRVNRALALTRLGHAGDARRELDQVVVLAAGRGDEAAGIMTRIRTALAELEASEPGPTPDPPAQGAEPVSPRSSG